eukprot:3858582-Prymnesium_polylepis.1
MGTQIPMLYSAQLCYSLVRAYELSRGEVSFDYVVRLRPDHLFVQPLEVGLNLSYAHWPRESVLSSAVAVQDFAIAPARLAAHYFRAFDAAAQCTFREPSALNDAFPPTLRCHERKPSDNLAGCILRASLAYAH